MIVTDDMRALYASAVANPRDDTVRLVYCDALQDTGDIDNEQRAEFIRKQIELHGIGLHPLTLEGTLLGHGPNYYQAMAIVTDGLKANQRIDFKGLYDRRRVVKRGLRVLNVEPSDPELGTVLVTLKEDEHSKPYPKKHVELLTRRCKDLLMGEQPTTARRWGPSRDELGNWELWRPNLPHNADEFGDRLANLMGFGVSVSERVGDEEWLNRNYPMLPTRVNRTAGRWVWSRGFISEVYCTWNHWELFGDYLVKHAPMCHVTFTTYPQWTEVPSAGMMNGKYPTVVMMAGSTLMYLPDEAVKMEIGHWDEAKTHCSRRWPSIPLEGWTIDRNVNAGRSYDGDGEGIEDAENVGFTDDF